jgi:predicted DCC family thiol-disulfide oxidoreductase YuxK
VSLSSALGQALTSGSTINKQSKDSIVYLENKNIFYRSTAILRIMKKLGKGWQLMYVLIIIPPFIRDVLYDLIAVNRYRWFGKKDQCAVLPPDRVSDDFIINDINISQKNRS